MKKDCFAYNQSGHQCNALVNTSCEQCRFYKTKEQQEADKARSLQRLKERGLYVFWKDKYNLG